MATKDFDNLNITFSTAKVSENIAQSTGTQGRKLEATQAEAAARREKLQTQGKKGAKTQRINMAFTDSNYDYIHTVARAKGLTMTKFVNEMIDFYRESHTKLYEEAKKLQKLANEE